MDKLEVIKVMPPRALSALMKIKPAICDDYLWEQIDMQHTS
jgi:hypothetical protein